MTDSFNQEDRSIDSDPDIEDWGVRGEEADRERQERINQDGYRNDAYEASVADKELKEYLAAESGFKEQIQELKILKEKLLPLLKEIKEKEEAMEAGYDWLWSEDENLYEDPYWNCETDEDKKAVDLERNYDYEMITPWIDQYKPISIVIEKQKELYESNKVLWKIGEEPRF
jgi:hypothetical protein